MQQSHIWTIHWNLTFCSVTTAKTPHAALCEILHPGSLQVESGSEWWLRGPEMLMCSNTDNISELWERIDANGPICLQGFISTECFIHLFALGCDFLRGIIDMLIFSWLHTAVLLWESIHRPFSSSRVSFWTRFLFFFFYFLQSQRPWKMGWYVNRQQAEKKLALAKFFTVFIYQQSVKCLYLCFPCDVHNSFAWRVLAGWLHPFRAPQFFHSS